MVIFVGDFWIWIPSPCRETHRKHMQDSSCWSRYLSDRIFDYFLHLCYAYIIQRLSRGSLLPNAFRGLPGWFPGYFVVRVGFCRPRVGTILGVNGAVLGYVGTFCFMFWQFWAIFGTVSSMQGVSKKHREYQQKIHFFDLLADGLCSFFLLFLLLSFWICCTWAMLA